MKNSQVFGLCVLSAMAAEVLTVARANRHIKKIEKKNNLEQEVLQMKVISLCTLISDLANTEDEAGRMAVVEQFWNKKQFIDIIDSNL
jgi:hypothetical protein